MGVLVRIVLRRIALLISFVAHCATLAILTLHVFSLFSVVHDEGASIAGFSLLYVGGIAVSSAPLLLLPFGLGVVMRGIGRRAPDTLSTDSKLRMAEVAYLACAVAALTPVPNPLHNLGVIGLSCTAGAALTRCARYLLSLSSRGSTVSVLLAAVTVVLCLAAPVLVALIGIVAGTLHAALPPDRTGDAFEKRTDILAPGLLKGFAITLLLVVMLAMCAYRDDVVSASYLQTLQGAIGVLTRAWALSAAGVLDAVILMLVRQAKVLRPSFGLVCAVLTTACSLLLTSLRFIDYLILLDILAALLISCEVSGAGQKTDDRDGRSDSVSWVPALAGLVSMGRPLLYPQLLLGQSPYVLLSYLVLAGGCLALLAFLSVLALRSGGVFAQHELATLADLSERSGLTRREYEVMRGVVAGVSLQGIAAQLGIARATAGTYATRAYRKLGVSDRAGMLEMVAVYPASGETVKDERKETLRATRTCLVALWRARAVIMGVVEGGMALFGTWGVLSETPLGKGDPSGTCVYTVVAVGVDLALAAAGDDLPWMDDNNRVAHNITFLGALGLCTALVVLLSTGKLWGSAPLASVALISLVILGILSGAERSKRSICWRAVGVGAAVFAIIVQPDAAPFLLTIGCVIAAVLTLITLPQTNGRGVDGADCAASSRQHGNRRLPLHLQTGLTLGAFGMVELLSYPLESSRPFIIILCGELVSCKSFAACILSVFVVGFAIVLLGLMRRLNLRSGALAQEFVLPCVVGCIFGGSLGTDGLLRITQGQHTLLCLGFMLVGVFATLAAIFRMAGREAQSGATDEELVDRIIDTTPLTRAEAQVALLLARGWSAKRIAEYLVISPQTVATHRKRIYRKLGVHRQSAVADALDM